MEETHQEVVLKLREDMKREEEKHISRAVAQVSSEEEEKQHEMMHEFKKKERERIQAAVDAERKIMESQHGSVTQLQQVLNFKNTVIPVVVPPKVCISIVFNFSCDWLSPSEPRVANDSPRIRWESWDVCYVGYYEPRTVC